jgi:stage II sporulation protein D
MPARHSSRPAHRVPAPAHRAPRPRGRALLTGLAVVAAGTLVGAANPADAAELYPAPSSGQYTVTGKGYGHGSGMSQYGAKGAATRGLTAAQITDFYYPGTKLTAAGDPVIRVRLSAVDSRPVAVAAQAGLVATDGAGKRWTLGTGTKVWRFVWTPAQNKFAFQQLVGSAYKTTAYAPGPLRIGGPATITVQFGRAKTDCKGLSTVTFAGTLRTVTDGGVQRSAADVRREYYLRGVVPSESPASWPAAALQAQSIAARSYAASQARPGAWYDAWDTTRDQCWDGAAAHHKNTDAAVKATAGKIRTYGGKPAFTQFSSSNGGYTTAGSQPYLVAKADPYEQYSGNPNATWTKQVPVASFRALAGLATVTRVRITARDGHGQWGGRVRTLVVDGTTSAGKAASRSFTGSQVRLSLGLRSTYVSLGTPAGGPTATVPTVWRKSNKTFYTRGGAAKLALGTPRTTPLLVDLNGDGRTEFASFDRQTGKWSVQGAGTFRWGQAGDVPVVGDRNGDRRTDIGVFRPSTGQFLLRSGEKVTWGRKGDIPFLRDFTGDRRADIAVYRPSAGVWYVRGRAKVRFGIAGDIPVPADYDGNGATELAVYRPSNGTWYVQGKAGVGGGARGDVPVPGDYDGNGRADLMRFRPSTAGWYPAGTASFTWGAAGRGDVPVTPLR